jgi:hypothetical protein
LSDSTGESPLFFYSFERGIASPESELSVGGGIFFLSTVKIHSTGQARKEETRKELTESYDTEMPGLQ